MRDYANEALSHDPVHGYLPFVDRPAAAGDVTEADIIDHPWVQRLRQIHQLQTAWWVFPTAEHTRFQHVLGVMHLAGQAMETLDESLRSVCTDVPSPGYLHLLMRMAGLLHDVGHGPFGHFLDEYFLSGFGLNHEILGVQIITQELGDLLRKMRNTHKFSLRPDEELDPAQIAYLIRRPTGSAPRSSAVHEQSVSEQAAPDWLRLLRSLFCGIYTVDNMDFVLRDGYMTGYSHRAFDLERLLHYSFFTPQGLTIHARGLTSLVRFITVRAELFRNVYFHRTVRAIDLGLQDLFRQSKEFLFPGNPAENLQAYQQFTEWSLLVDVARWHRSAEPKQAALGQKWRQFLERKLSWKMAVERTVFFPPQMSEKSSVFGSSGLFEQALREQLPPALKSLHLRVDLARHVHRPGTRTPASGQNFLFDPHRGVTPLDDDELFRQIPISFRICRVYAETAVHQAALAKAVDAILGSQTDDPTNM